MHYISLCFVGPHDNLGIMLEPYEEEALEQYMEFCDDTETVVEKFNSLPEKDERLNADGKPYPFACDKSVYPTMDDLARDYYCYTKKVDEDGTVHYGYECNPNGRWDWYAIGNRWNGYIFTKDGKEVNCAKFDDVDWDRMFEKDTDGYAHIPYTIVDHHGEWHDKEERGEYRSEEYMQAVKEWEEWVKNYVAEVKALPEDVRDGMDVYAVDYHN